MKNKLVRLSHLSGDAASIYSIYYSDKEEVLFERFIRENITHSPEETMNIVRRLRSIGKRSGVQDISRIVHVKLEHGSLYLSEDGLKLEGNMILIN